MNSDVNAIDRIPETDYSEDGVDLTLIRWMLSLTPVERRNSSKNGSTKFS